METLPAVNSIPGPSISGQVSVPLAELDRMRSDHANAIKLAQELEQKQKQIKIIHQYTEQIVTSVEEDVYHPGVSGGRYGLSTPGYHERVKKFVNKGVQKEDSIFLNMDEIMGALKEKATALVKKETDVIIAARNKAEKHVIKLKKNNSDDKTVYNKQAAKRDEEIVEKAITIGELQEKLEKAEETVKEQEEQLVEAIDAIVEAKEEVTASSTVIINLRNKLADESLTGKIGRFFS